MKNFLVTIAILLGGGATFYFINQNERKEYIEKLRSEEYFGVVDSIFLDPDSRMQPNAVLNRGTKVSVQNDIYKKVAQGDILFKKAGSLKYYFIHNGDTIIYYQEYEGRELKD